MDPITIAVLAGAGFLFLTTPAAASEAASSSSSSPPPSARRARFIDLFNQYGPKYGVPVLWLEAFCQVESSFGEDPSVKAGELSEDGLSKGIMQLTLLTAGDYQTGVTLDDLNDPETSVRIACQFIKFIRSSFDPSDPRYTEWCVKSYNQGVGGTQKERDGLRDGAAESYWEKWQAAYADLGGTL